MGATLRRQRTVFAPSRGEFRSTRLADPLHEVGGIRFARTWLTSLLAIAVAAGTSHAEPKRDVPDYDGRGNPDADAGSWALWIPRVVLSPLYVVNEYVLRRPVGALVTH